MTTMNKKKTFDQAKLELVRYVLERIGVEGDYKTLLDRKLAEIREDIDFGDKGERELRNAVGSIVMKKYGSLYDWEAGLD